MGLRAPGQGDVAVKWHGLPRPEAFRLPAAHALRAATAEPGLQRRGAARGVGHQELTLKIGPISAHATMKYGFFAVLNDFPHLTPNGEAALAGNVRSSLGL